MRHDGKARWVEIPEGVRARDEFTPHTFCDANDPSTCIGMIWVHVGKGLRAMIWRARKAKR